MDFSKLYGTTIRSAMVKVAKMVYQEIEPTDTQFREYLSNGSDLQRLIDLFSLIKSDVKIIPFLRLSRNGIYSLSNYGNLNFMIHILRYITKILEGTNSNLING